jgi:hypothetical protein
MNFRALCGRSVGWKIVVADCAAPDADWISATTYKADARPDCLSTEVVRRLPGGRHRCWYHLAF